MSVFTLSKTTGVIYYDRALTFLPSGVDVVKWGRLDKAIACKYVVCEGPFAMHQYTDTVNGYS